MDHPPSPNRGHAHLIQEGHSPSSPPGPPAGHHMGMPPEAMGSGYRGMPPGSYGHPPGYPPYQGHSGAPPQSPYGASGPSPHHGHAYTRGQPTPGGFPGASYPPPHQSPSYPPYGYHPGAPVPPGAGRLSYYGYEGGYPGQPGQPGQPVRPGSSPYRSPPTMPGRPVAPASSPEATQQASPYSSPTSSPQGSVPKASPERSPESTSQSSAVKKLANNTEVERLRAAAAQELTTEEVRPIETDFHFFVKDNLEQYKKLAEDQVRKSTNNESGELDPFLVNTNLNSRLLAAWEKGTQDNRDIYRKKEEDDRIRFMAEDEIASRHCATLTARGKSPRETTLKKKEEQRQESDSKSPNRDSPMAKSVIPSANAGPSSPRAAAADSEPPKRSSDTVEATSIKDTTSEVSTGIPKEPAATSQAEDEEMSESPQKKSRISETTEAS
ncbi:unnamed protein product [Cylindrotheca closterium]|uniref:Uncharacterized protein n=1 Tax=Cylindrotheca closterium TaxID=2856 RepID=A0AAD2G7Z7_9STRA|nr:unnamed protein product [Cylindrotheca closterium]